MNVIKRLDAMGVSEKLGVSPATANFIFKPVDKTPDHKFEPHRSEMYTLALILKGGADLTIGVDHYHIQAPGLVAIAPDDIREWKTVDKSLSIVSIFFTEDFVAAHTPFHFISLDEHEFTTMKAIFDLIALKAGSTDHNKINSLQAMTVVALTEAKSLHEKRIIHPSQPHTQGYVLTEKFKQLLAKDFIHHRSVKYYADQLFISSKHLSQSIKEQTGRTAGEMIDDRVGLEAKILLQNASLNIAQVAAALNFASATFFGKFFKRLYNMTPLEYRIRHLAH